MWFSKQTFLFCKIFPSLIVFTNIFLFCFLGKTNGHSRRKVVRAWLFVGCEDITSPLGRLVQPLVVPLHRKPSPLPFSLLLLTLSPYLSSSWLFSLSPAADSLGSHLTIDHYSFVFLSVCLYLFVYLSFFSLYFSIILCIKLFVCICMYIFTYVSICPFPIYLYVSFLSTCHSACVSFVHLPVNQSVYHPDQLTCYSRLLFFFNRN